MIASAPSPLLDGAQRLWRSLRVRHFAPGALVLVALYVCWPLLAGHMPRSADHTVHLARAAASCELWSSAQLRGWSTMWAFGVPLGDLYPVLGDLCICALSQVTPSIETAYAWTMVLVMGAGLCSSYLLGQTICAAFAPQLSSVCGSLCALFWLSDLGAYREGGWIYSVLYGVWPQSLATSLAWMALAFIHKTHQDPHPYRIRLTALCIAAALLAHPMALVQLAIVSTLWALCVRKSPHAIPVLGSMLLGMGLSAWWWLPMLDLRASMASYGWLFDGTRYLMRQLAQGQWTQAMFPPIGYAALLGVGACFLQRSSWPRVLAASALTLWLASSRDLYADLRMDLWGSPFAHVQYQRFLFSAKPAIFALAALGLCLPLALFGQGRRQASRHKLGAGLMLLGALAYLVYLHAPAQIKLARQAKLWDWPRVALTPSLHQDYQDLLSWLRSHPHPKLRIHAKDARNLHWFMDLSVHTGHELYKSGFTPGDNFIHKPESRTSTLLSRLALTHELTRIDPSSQRPANAQRFGSIQLRPVPPSWRNWQLEAQDAQSLRVSPPGTLRPLSPQRWHIDLQEASKALTIQLPIAYYARWSLYKDGAKVPLFATPAAGQRRGQRLADRDPLHLYPGRARGNLGHGPTLASFVAQGPGRYELRYETWRMSDLVGLALSGLSLAGLFVIPPRAKGALKLHLLALGGLSLLLLLGIYTGYTQSRLRAEHWSSWPGHGQRVHLGYLKSNMRIERALIARLRQKAPARWTLDPYPMPKKLALWWSLDDDQAQLPGHDAARYRIRVSLVVEGQDLVLLDETFQHRPDRSYRELDTSRWAGQRLPIRIEVRSDQAQRVSIGWDAWPIDLAPKGDAAP